MKTISFGLRRRRLLHAKVLFNREQAKFVAVLGITFFVDVVKNV